MSHVVTQRKKLVARINRLLGQLEALKRAVEEAQTDEQCNQIMGQIASIRGAINGMLMLFIEEHIRLHVAAGKTRASRDTAADDLVSALSSYRT